MLAISSTVASALKAGHPVVALESSLIAHGLPWPMNIETAQGAEAAVRECGVAPATIAVWNGQPTIGLSEAQIAELGRRDNVLKASRRDLATAIALGRTAATTVAATIFLAHKAGIRVMATGGIGGVHRNAESTFDVSADLVELSRTPVVVVCAGAKSILDISKTLEALETLAVPVIGYQCDRFPAFFVRSSDLAAPIRVETAAEVARIAKTHFALNGGGLVVAQPVAAPAAMSSDDFDVVLRMAEASVGVRIGNSVTPALLAKLAEVTDGRTLSANRELIVANARLAAQIAASMASSPAASG